MLDGQVNSPNVKKMSRLRFFVAQPVSTGYIIDVKRDRTNMARITYQNRLENIINNPYCSARDKEFAGDLLTYYKRNRKLTAGRARCVKQMEERYSPDACAKIQRLRDQGEADPEILSLRALEGRCEPSSWDKGFLESVIDQSLKGRELSPRQDEILDKIKERNSEDAIKSRRRWEADWVVKPRLSEEFRVMMDYYRANPPYFSNIVTAFDIAESLEGHEYKPSKKVWEKVCGGKYAIKVINAHWAEPKYPVGSTVVVRATAKQFPNIYKGKAAAVISTTEPIRNASKGCKRYKILLMGVQKPALVDEKDIKIYRAPKA